jgi:DNA-binding NarL/FixJ family response regulator
MESGQRVFWRRGKLYIEVQAVIRIPLSIQPIAESEAVRIKLTRREQQVFDGLLKGLANKEIANAIHISLRMVKFHVSTLLRKFHVTSRGELMALFGKSRSGDNTSSGDKVNRADSGRT